mmetsp:Transcript_11433/g.34723  ORF Transcript_11433/g.34723 Transcript_11433/m.34723 type:complete len:481 (-) Transcript_11433:93-1535(-)
MDLPSNGLADGGEAQREFLRRRSQAKEAVVLERRVNARHLLAHLRQAPNGFVVEAPAPLALHPLRLLSDALVAEALLRRRLAPDVVLKAAPPLLCLHEALEHASIQLEDAAPPDALRLARVRCLVGHRLHVAEERPRAEPGELDLVLLKALLDLREVGHGDLPGQQQVDDLRLVALDGHDAAVGQIPDLTGVRDLGDVFVARVREEVVVLDGLHLLGERVQARVVAPEVLVEELAADHEARRVRRGHARGLARAIIEQTELAEVRPRRHVVLNARVILGLHFHLHLAVCEDAHERGVLSYGHDGVARRILHILDSIEGRPPLRVLEVLERLHVGEPVADQVELLRRSLPRSARQKRRFAPIRRVGSLRLLLLQLECLQLLCPPAPRSRQLSLLIALDGVHPAANKEHEKHALILGPAGIGQILVKIREVHPDVLRMSSSQPYENLARARASPRYHQAVSLSIPVRRSAALLLAAALCRRR